MATATTKRLAGVELGGTSWLLAIAVDDPQNIVARTRIETTTPAETLSAAVAWLQTQTFDAIGACPSSVLVCMCLLAAVPDNVTCRHRVLRSDRPEPSERHVRLHHEHAQARVGQHRDRRRVRARVPRRACGL